MDQHHCEPHRGTDAACPDEDALHLSSEYDNLDRIGSSAEEKRRLQQSSCSVAGESVAEELQQCRGEETIAAEEMQQC